MLNRSGGFGIRPLAMVNNYFGLRCEMLLHNKNNINHGDLAIASYPYPLIQY